MAVSVEADQKVSVEDPIIRPDLVRRARESYKSGILNPEGLTLKELYHVIDPVPAYLELLRESTSQFFRMRVLYPLRYLLRGRFP